MFRVTGVQTCALPIFSYALQNFMYSNDSSYYYVYQQPADPREEDDIRRAMDICPMNCIQDDGELL
jgi:hypothetical protein